MNHSPLRIRKVAVLGAGVMGAQIAAHLVNADVETILFDLPAKEGPKSGIAIKAIANLGKLSPAPLAEASRALAITPANYDEHLELLKGCDLIICYNPFRPFLNRIDAEGGDTPYFANGRYLADRGMKMVLNQVFRTLLHSRLKLGLQRYLTDDRFQGDILLLEPRERDTEFFNVNPLAFWKRQDAIHHGFESVRLTIEQNFETVQDVLSHYGLETFLG